MVDRAASVNMANLAALLSEKRHGPALLPFAQGRSRSTGSGDDAFKPGLPSRPR